MTVTEQGLLEREKDSMTLNMGPQHPSTHGVFRVVLGVCGDGLAGVCTCLVAE